MPLYKELDTRITVNIQSDKKKELQAIAAAKHMSLSKFVLDKIIDEWLKNRESDGCAS